MTCILKKVYCLIIKCFMLHHQYTHSHTNSHLVQCKNYFCVGNLMPFKLLFSLRIIKPVWMVRVTIVNELSRNQKPPNMLRKTKLTSQLTSCCHS